MKFFDRVTGVYDYKDKSEDIVKVNVGQTIKIFETNKCGKVGGIINVGSNFGNADEIDVEVFVNIPDPGEDVHKDSGIVPMRQDYRVIRTNFQSDSDYSKAAPVWTLEEVYMPYGGFILIANKGSFQRRVYHNIYRRDCE